MKQSVGRRVRRRRRMLALLVLVLILFVQCGKLTLRSDAGIRAPMSLVAFLSGSPLWGISSRNALLMDLQSGEVLAQKNADEQRAPASLTKMMTILLAVEELPDLQQPVTLPEDIYAQLYAEDASMAGFQPGETVTVQDLLYGAMLPSGAECCETLARQVSGSEEAFVALMNQNAQELGMNRTHFNNTTGLPETGHVSTAADLAVLLQAALQNETFRMLFTTAQYTTTPTVQHPDGLTLHSTLLGKLTGKELANGQILGGKTGYTSEAGLCLASLAEVNGREYILVTLGAPGNHATEQMNLSDAIRVYGRLKD